jgi:hypothetical protein
MTPLGRDFKAPRRSAKAQWLKLELLSSFGIRFEVPVDTAGGPGERPRRLNEAVGFLVARGFERLEVEQRLAELRRLRSGKAADAE